MHGVSELTTVLFPARSSACPLSHALHMMPQSTVEQRLEVTGRFNRDSGDDVKWGKIYSFALSLPFWLLYFDSCSQSVQEEAALRGAKTPDLWQFRHGQNLCERLWKSTGLLTQPL